MDKQLGVVEYELEYIIKERIEECIMISYSISPKQVSLFQMDGEDFTKQLKAEYYGTIECQNLLKITTNNT